MGTDLVPAGTYDLENVSNAAQLWREELGADFVPTFPRIKVPSGGGTIWEVPGDDPETPAHSPAITGVLVAFHKSSRLYFDSFEDRDADNGGRPDAWSNDGVVQFVSDEAISKAAALGLPAPLTDVARDPYHKFPNEGGVQLRGNGKAANEYYELYILVAGNVLPWQVSVPAGSMNKVTEYLGSVVASGHRISGVETVIGLGTANNKQNIKYSVVTLKRGAVLDAEAAAAAQSYSEGIKAIVKRDPYARATTPDTTADFVVEPAAPQTDTAVEQVAEAFDATPVGAGASADLDL